MKYASEVIDLMACYPGRRFRLVELVRHASRGRALCPTETTRMQRGIQRALEALKEAGSVEIDEPDNGSHGRKYVWRVTIPSHCTDKSVTRSVTISPGR